jgi:hypothetical protein
MSDQVHTIRFKRDGVEFELTGSEADVQKAWSALESSVVSAFGRGTAQHQAPAPEPQAKGKSSDGGEGQTKVRKRTSRRSAGGTKSPDGRADVLKKLLDADHDTFPELPDDAQAVYKALAALQWARETLAIDGLSIGEIRTFLSEKLRYSETAPAYRYGLNQLPRATNGTGSPKVYKLMRPGDQALEAYLKTVRAGGSESDAEQAGAAAEQKA